MQRVILFPNEKYIGTHLVNLVNEPEDISHMNAMNFMLLESLAGNAKECEVFGQNQCNHIVSIPKGAGSNQPGTSVYWDELRKVSIR